MSRNMGGSKKIVRGENSENDLVLVIVLQRVIRTSLEKKLDTKGPIASQWETVKYQYF